MNKILVVINAHRPNMASVDFACRVAAFTHSKFTGLFIENIYFQHSSSALDDTSYFQTVQTKGDDVATDTAHAVKLFVQECDRFKVPAETYVDMGEPIQEAIYESRFADLIIIDPSLNFYDVEEQLPSHFTKEILANAECPILLSPEKPVNIATAVFCYDGSASSVFAFKQFTYLLPEMKNKKAILLEINKNGNTEFNEDHRRIMAWMKAHYAIAEYHALKGQVKDELFHYFLNKTNEVIVMGAYGRSMLSNFFRRSTAETLIESIDLPIFITHYKD